MYLAKQFGFTHSFFSTNCGTLDLLRHSSCSVSLKEGGATAQTQEVSSQRLLLAASTFLHLLVSAVITCSRCTTVREKLKVQCCQLRSVSVLVFVSDSQTLAAVEMATGDLVPTHFPARRAAQAALHYLNIHHGSPFRVFGLQQVHKATAEDVGAGGRKYSLEFSVTDWASSGSVLRCSADVLFPRTEPRSPPDVQLHCEDLQISSSPEEEAFYQKHISPDSAVSAQDIPDSYGNMSQDMKPFWHLARVAASFIMLRESSENTEYNMAQVANITQQETSGKQLMLKYHVLLHDIVSQEIIHWKLLSSWSPDGGVRVLETEWQPKCPHATKPPSAN